MVAQLNGAFDMALDGQIFAAVQLALDDDRLPKIHDVLLHMMTRLRTRRRNPRRAWRGRLRRSRWLSACRSDSFIAFPHVILRLSVHRDAPGLNGYGSLGCLPSKKPEQLPAS